jgi:outer membrane protein assembly complex protein YaeT
MIRAIILTLIMTVAASAGVYAADEKIAPEGARAMRLNRIVVLGCKQVPKRLVKAILRQKPTPWYELKPGKHGYDPFWAEEDRARIERYYRSRGFYSVKVSAPEIKVGKSGRGVTVTYRIEEGAPVKVATVAVEFADEHDEDDEKAVAPLVKLKAGDRFDQMAYENTAKAIVTHYQDDAYFKAQVERKAVVSAADGSAAVTYKITKGARYRLRSIAVEGNQQTDESVVRRAVTLEEDRPYYRDRAQEDRRRIQRLPIYRQVRLEEKADDEDKRIDLTIHVVEAEPQMIKLGVGWGNEEQFRVKAQWQHLNFFGGARQFGVTARWSQLLEREEVSFIQPNLNQPGDYLLLSAFHQIENEKEYRAETVAFVPTWHLILTKYLWAELSYHVESSQLSRVVSFKGIKDEDLSKQGLLSALSGRLEWADVDDPIRPTRGARAGIYLEYAGGPFGGDFNYVKALGEARGYWSFGPVTAALKWELGWAEPLDGMVRIPLFKRFWAGGTGSVRGFNRHQLGPLDRNDEPFGGAKLWDSSLELRFPVWEQFGGVVFFDGGWVWLEDQPYDFGDVMYSAGLGLRYDTPVGPLAFDVGFPLTGRSPYPAYQIHFNIGHTF